jgi:2-keto-4-pentenoate hydratase
VTSVSTDLRDAAFLLDDVLSRCIPTQPLTQRYPNLTVRQTYGIQNLGPRLDDRHALRGHTIGLTSAPMQQLLGVSEAATVSGIGAVSVEFSQPDKE